MQALLFGAVIAIAAYALFRPRHREPVADDVLLTRVRLRLDELLAQPGAVNLEVHDGCIVLTGPVAERELRPVKRALRAMPGVRRVDCRLTAHA